MSCISWIICVDILCFARTQHKTSIRCDHISQSSLVYQKHPLNRSHYRNARPQCGLNPTIRKLTTPSVVKPLTPTQSGARSLPNPDKTLQSQRKCHWLPTFALNSHESEESLLWTSRLWNNGRKSNEMRRISTRLWLTTTTKASVLGNTSWGNQVGNCRVGQ